MLYKSTYNSSIGKLTLASNGNKLIGLWIEGQKYFESTINEETIENNELEVFRDTKNWLDLYFAGENPNISNLPLLPQGNDFRQCVWGILCKIPYGKTTTYSEIAKEIAIIKGLKSMSAQAVGGAIGRNPISIIIPCHRVVGKNGSLTGYAGGIDIKTLLLKHEGAL